MVQTRQSKNKGKRNGNGGNEYSGKRRGQDQNVESVSGKSGESNKDIEVTDTPERDSKGNSHKIRLDLKWQKKFDQLVQFRDQNGHCIVPKSHSIIGEWVRAQRVFHRRNKLREDRFNQLQEIGFCWDASKSKDCKGLKPNERWEHYFNQLLQFKSKHGHLRVTAKNCKNPSFAKWVVNQRRFSKNNTILEERKRRLDDIGFIWKIHDGENPDEIWDNHFNQLVEFRDSQGHCNVPPRYKNQKLVTWLGLQRVNHNRNQLSEERKRRLDEIGFNWKGIKRGYQPVDEEGNILDGSDTAKVASPKSKMNLDQRWKKSFDELLDFKAQHGHLTLPKRHPINAWLYFQKCRYKRKVLEMDRLKKLQDAGVDWIDQSSNYEPVVSVSKSDMLWDKRFKQLQAFKASNNHCTVPHDEENKILANWLHMQQKRYNNNVLARDRIERLKGIGVQLERKCDGSDFSKKFWEKRFNQLVEFKNSHGHFDVPYRYMNRRLIRWIQNQRLKRRRKLLSEDRIKRLEEIGFNWEGFRSGENIPLVEKEGKKLNDEDKKALKRERSAKHAQMQARLDRVWKKMKGLDAKQIAMTRAAASSGALGVEGRGTSAFGRGGRAPGRDAGRITGRKLYTAYVATMEMAGISGAGRAVGEFGPLGTHTRVQDCTDGTKNPVIGFHKPANRHRNKYTFEQTMNSKFLKHLHLMIMAAEASGKKCGKQCGISWTPDGYGFTINDKDRFASEMLHLYFPKMNKFETLKCALYRWGIRVSDRGVWRHSMGWFHRGSHSANGRNGLWRLPELVNLAQWLPYPSHSNTSACTKNNLDAGEGVNTDGRRTAPNMKAGAIGPWTGRATKCSAGNEKVAEEVTSK